MLNPLALAGCGWIIVILCRELGYKPTTARWLALAAIFSTMLWPYVKGFYPQPSVTFFLLGAIYFAYRWRRTHQDLWLWLLSVLLGMMILFRLSAVVVLPSLIMYIFFTSPKRNRWRWLLPLAVCLGIAGVLVLSYNWFRFGSFFEFGYHEVAWNYPPLMGLYGLLFSPGKGVLFYSPLLVLSSVGLLFFWRWHRFETLLILFLWLSYLAFYAPYNFWTGGFNWGPRFLMPVVPLAILPLGCILERDSLRGGRHLFYGLFLLGVLVQLPAILVDHSRYLFTAFDSGDIHAAYGETIINFDQSPIVRQWPTAIHLMKAYTQPETWESARASIDSIIQTAPNVQNGEAILVSDFLRRNTLNIWWLNYPGY
jgi:4-amino-4-deoxy-L-arabinose transferase-like glycosyltransferase